MTSSPFAKLFQKLMDRITETMPEIKHIDQDTGQLEGASSRPDVAFPLILVKFENWAFTDTGDNGQVAIGDVVVKLAYAQYTPSSNLVGPAYREEALKYYELGWELNNVLHGWSPDDEFGFLTRTGLTTETRQPGIQVFPTRYRLEFEDYSARPVKTTMEKPPLLVEGEMD